MNKKPAYADLEQRIKEIEEASAEAKRLQAALRESEEKFRALADSTPTAVMLYQDDRYIYANRAAETISGYSPADLLGMNFWEIIHPDFIAQIKERGEKRQHGRETANRYELKIITKDGREKWVDLAGASTMVGGRLSGIISVVDINERKKAETELSRLKAILDSTSDLVGASSAAGLKLYLNAAGYRMAGLSLDEDLSRLHMSEMHPAWAWQIIEKEGIPRAIAEGVWEGETAIRSRDGREIPVSQVIIAHFGPNREVAYLSTIMRDISEHKQTEAALQRSEERYRSLVENANEAILVVQDGAVKFVNSKAVRSFGYAEQEFLSIPIFGLVHPEDRDAVRERYLQKMKGDTKPTRYACRMIHKNGQTFWIEISSVLIDWEGRPATLNLITDITDRKQAEEALRESEEKYRTIIEQMEDGYFEVDLAGNFTFVNDAESKILGYSRDELIGMNNRQYQDAADARQIYQLFSRLYATGEPIKAYGSEIIRKNGTKGFHEISVSLIRNAEGQPIGFRGISRDVTQRKQAEDEKRSLEERLNRAKKMEALGQLAGGVAHDLNNVLGALSGYSELLLMEIPEGQRARGHAEKILQSTEKGAAIIQDLLTLARRGVTTADVINLNSVVSDFLHAPMFTKMKSRHPHIIFRTQCQEELLNIRGSSIHLEKTLMNLVLNAAESIAGKGEVSIRTESVYLDKPVRGYDEITEGDYAVLTVSDTGTGIPAEHIEKIFEPFYTKKTMGRSGTGLGLAIVWGTVKDHNGYIDVQSKVGEGTSFTLYFPVTREAVMASYPKAPIERYLGRGESVLVIDDIAEQRDVASSLLAELGYKVHVVSSGEEALEYLKSHPADILVLDMIMLPGMDGLETYRQVLKINPKQKAILVSGFSETDRVREAQALGAGVYVKKPYVMEKIGMAIRDELQR